MPMTLEQFWKYVDEGGIAVHGGAGQFQKA
jgi:hypothetical protein